MLDNCMGSGSTGVACKKLDRQFIGMESDPEYFKISQGRIQNTVPVEKVEHIISNPLLDAL